MSYKASLASLEKHSDKTCTKCDKSRHRSKSGSVYTPLCQEHYRESQRKWHEKNDALRAFKVGYGDGNNHKTFPSLKQANDFMRECLNSGNLIRFLIKIE